MLYVHVKNSIGLGKKQSVTKIYIYIYIYIYISKLYSNMLELFQRVRAKPEIISYRKVKK